MEPETTPNSSESELDALRTENAHLQARLAKAEYEAEMFRSAAYKMLNRLDQEQPPTEA